MNIAIEENGSSQYQDTVKLLLSTEEVVSVATCISVHKQTLEWITPTVHYNDKLLTKRPPFLTADHKFKLHQYQLKAVLPNFFMLNKVSCYMVETGGLNKIPQHFERTNLCHYLLRSVRLSTLN